MCSSAHAAESNEENTVVVQFNVSTYGDYLGLRDPEFKKAIGVDDLYNEKNIFLKAFFKDLRQQINPDIILLQEAYGFDPQIEKRKNGIRDLIKKFQTKGYALIKDCGVKPMKPGDALILFKKQKIKYLDSISLEKSA